MTLRVRYIYCDNTSLGTIESAGQLLYAAKKYMIPHLVRICLDYLQDHTHIKTLWDVLSVAEDLHEEELLASCIKVRPINNTDDYNLVSYITPTPVNIGVTFMTS